jgi:acrylyl-CoA reductase (NADPH)
MDLPGSVAPFILRNVALLGVDSVMCPTPLRLQAWERLSRDLDRDHFASLTQTISLEEAIATAGKILAGEVRGRTVIEI